MDNDEINVDEEMVHESVDDKYDLNFVIKSYSFGRSQ